MMRHKIDLKPCKLRAIPEKQAGSKHLTENGIDLKVSLKNSKLCEKGIKSVTQKKRLKTKMEAKDQVSDETLSDSNLEELKQQWTLEQLELSKRVSEVCFPAVFVASY